MEVIFLIIESILRMFFDGFGGLMSYFPAELPYVGLALGSLVEPLQFACYYFGSSNLAYAIGSIVFWAGVQISWAVVEWLYKKIPGVN